MSPFPAWVILAAAQSLWRSKYEWTRSFPTQKPTHNKYCWGGRIEVGENEGKNGEKMYVNFERNLPRNYLVKIFLRYIRLKKKII